MPGRVGREGPGGSKQKPPGRRKGAGAGRGPRAASVDAEAPGRAVFDNAVDARLAHARLKESEERYRIVVESAFDPIFVFGEDGKFVSVNAAAARHLALPPEVLIGKTMHDVFPKAIADRQWGQIRKVFESGVPLFSEERESYTAEGPRWFNTSLTPVHGADGRVKCVIGIARDVTERKRTEQALRESEARYRAVVEAQTELVARFLPDGTITFMNEASCRYTGGTREDMIGRSFLPWLPEEDRSALVRLLASVTGANPVAELEHRVRLPTGEIRWMHWTNQGIFDAEGRLMEFQAVGHDITARKQLEERLIHAQKMEAIGRLAGGIAHDFNNLMTGILCHADLLKGQARRGDGVYEGAEIIEGAAKRAAELTGQLLGFARRGKHQNVPVDMHEVVRSVARLAGGALDRRIRVRQDLRADPPIALGDPAQMEQAVLNLAINARDAMPHGGEMAFVTGFVELREPKICFHAAIPPGRYFTLSVADTGEGIADELKEHMFEPFFTTKPRGKGTGMGLAMVYGIVRNHGGYVDLESQAGQGSTFTIYLPAKPGEGAAAAEAAPVPAGEPVRGAGRILVVDDEEIIRDVTQRMLTGLGYEVACVVDGDEAAAYYAAHRGQIQLVIIDMQMFRMDGRACFRALRAIDPRVRAIVSTGCGFDGAVQQMLDEGVSGFVQKPFEVGRLSRVVAAALGQGDPGRRAEAPA